MAVNVLKTSKEIRSFFLAAYTASVFAGIGQQAALSISGEQRPQFSSVFDGSNIGVAQDNAEQKARQLNTFNKYKQQYINHIQKIIKVKENALAQLYIDHPSDRTNSKNKLKSSIKRTEVALENALANNDAAVKAVLRWVTANAREAAATASTQSIYSQYVAPALKNTAPAAKKVIPKALALGAGIGTISYVPDAFLIGEQIAIWQHKDYNAIKSQFNISRINNRTVKVTYFNSLQPLPPEVVKAIVSTKLHLLTEGACKNDPNPRIYGNARPLKIEIRDNGCSIRY